MTIFTPPAWSDALLTGNSIIDEQHQALLVLCGEIVGILSTTSKPQTKDLESRLQRLVELAKAHYAEEERLLAANRCPHLNGHTAEHRAYLVTLAKIASHPSESNFDRVGLSNALIDYIHNHLFETDLHSRDFFRPVRRRSQ